VDVVDIADVSEVHAVSIFTFESFREELFYVNIKSYFEKSDWGTLVPRIDVENGIKLGFVLE
jgi:hypothetical protein